jgi:hypothetical protein
LIAGIREQYQLSERRACRIMVLQRSVNRFQPQPNRDGEVIRLLLELAHGRPEQGFRSCSNDYVDWATGGITNVSIAFIAA